MSGFKELFGTERPHMGPEQDNPLCPSCFTWALKRFIDLSDPPWLHCHHPRIDKPPCKWCEAWKKVSPEMDFQATVSQGGYAYVADLKYLIYRGESLETCPMCGTKLT